MADSSGPQKAQPAPKKVPTVEERLTALEEAVASLGMPKVTHKHDGFARFLAWFEGKFGYHPDSPPTKDAEASKPAA